MCLETLCKLLTLDRQQKNISTFFRPTGGSYRPLFNASSKVPGAAALLREASSTGTSARSKRQTSKSTCNQAKSLHSILTTLFFCSKASKKMSSCVPTESLDYEWIHLIMQDRIPLEYFFHEFCGKLNSTKLGEMYVHSMNYVEICIPQNSWKTCFHRNSVNEFICSCKIK